MISPNLNGGFHTKKNYITVSQYGNKQQFIKLLHKLNMYKNELIQYYSCQINRLHKDTKY